MFYYYFCAIFTLISAAVSFGFSVSAYVKSRQQKDAALNNSKYALSRSLSLLMVAIGLLVLPSVPYLIAVSVIMISVQAFGGIVGIKISTFKTLGPVLTAVGNTALLVLLLVNQ